MFVCSHKSPSSLALIVERRTNQTKMVITQDKFVKRIRGEMFGEKGYQITEARGKT